LVATAVIAVLLVAKGGYHTVTNILNRLRKPVG